MRRSFAGSPECRRNQHDCAENGSYPTRSATIAVVSAPFPGLSPRLRDRAPPPPVARAASLGFGRLTLRAGGRAAGSVRSPLSSLPVGYPAPRAACPSLSPRPVGYPAPGAAPHRCTRPAASRSGLPSVTTTSTAPTACAATVQVSVVLFTTCTVAQLAPPMLTLVPAANPDPVSVTVFPPVVIPAAGLIRDSTGSAAPSAQRSVGRAKPR